MQLPDELVNKVIMMQRAKYPWTHKEINKASLLRELFIWAKSYNNEQFLYNVAITIDSYINAIEEDTSEMDEEELEWQREYVLDSWNDFTNSIWTDWGALHIEKYVELDEKFLKSLRFYWHHRYH